jgi:hypothetical protein
MGHGRRFDQPYCPATIYIDGIKIQGGAVEIDNLIQPIEVAGVEVYASGNTAPAAYQPLNGSCAVLLFWTKTGR